MDFKPKSNDNLKDKKTCSRSVNGYYKKLTAQKSGYYKIWKKIIIINAQICKSRTVNSQQKSGKEQISP
jgi:hypothetical protein